MTGLCHEHGRRRVAVGREERRRSLLLEPECVQPREGAAGAADDGIAQSHGSRERQRRGRQQLLYPPDPAEAAAEADLVSLALEERPPPPLGVAVEALIEHGRVVDLEPVPVADTVDHEVRFERRGPVRTVAEPVREAGDEPVPTVKRRANGERQPGEGLQNGGLARGVGAVDAGDRQHSLRELIEAPRGGPILVDGDHRQLHRIQD